MDAVENENNKFWIHNGILYSCFKKPMDMTLEEAIKTIALRHKISKSEYWYWCLDIRNLRSTSREANNYIEENGQELVHACAAIVNSYLTKFLIDVFNFAKKPKVPLKTFTSEKNAVLWLNEMKKQNKKA